uniref:Uncharacterized protein n=1 Tax=Anguilla anguilla TaxID=7936 RepID=A0A0E9UB09_ANGAN
MYRSRVYNLIPKGPVWVQISVSALH